MDLCPSGEGQKAIGEKQKMAQSWAMRMEEGWGLDKNK